ncbi:hypothetical protein BGI15_07530 [Snodgrassella alvi]|uniref:DUF4261 domain-containing protein n=1 Tax=Snodgrassella alvi TaxID=1196083 RepID=UPI0009FEF17F|nr:DUF4261 domain-containing protein [Snodgrassella alvi]ORF24614.1 hypothetical protein BGI07_07635 [Snodgrassella alvi]ORF33260.1 hypothetical protein BGI11_09075 [Snodgrassella alvi]ORF33796.1 hypothetical protein BGI10_01015 [Snodgrassella alvi]ORF37142.1 hypothetical protein BGI13_08500 [Snodgrassella alvi]ORF37734.1 hypothetical protein BGI14_10250 [Snodgrassella alvi]
MSLFARLFGKKSKDTVTTVAENTNTKQSIGLSVVFKGSLNFDKDNLLDKLRYLDSSITNVKYETPAGELEQGVFALISWGKHVVKLIGFNAPFPADALETCVEPAHYSEDIKNQVRKNDSHVILYYTGHDEDVIQQYLALSRLAACFEEFNALAVINENAHSSLPANVLSNLLSDENSAQSLCDCLPLFFCGFVKYILEDVKGVWMRTYGADVFGLPDFAVLANNHDEGSDYFDMFGNILSYLRQSGATMNSGDTMEIGDNKMMSLRAPQEDEYFLKDTGNVLVVEIGK